MRVYVWWSIRQLWSYNTESIMYGYWVEFLWGFTFEVYVYVQAIYIHNETTLFYLECLFMVKCSCDMCKSFGYCNSLF